MRRRRLTSSACVVEVSMQRPGQFEKNRKRNCAAAAPFE